MDEYEEMLIDKAEVNSHEPGPWIICPDCGGDGHHCHDALMVPSQEMLEDDDAMEGYFAGRYDVNCDACNGSGKVRENTFSSKRLGGPGMPFERGGCLYNSDGEPLESPGG